MFKNRPENDTHQYLEVYELHGVTFSSSFVIRRALTGTREDSSKSDWKKYVSHVNICQK